MIIQALKRLWTPHPRPQETHYLYLPHHPTEQVFPPQNAAMYGLLDSENILQERFLAFPPLSFMRRLACRMLHTLHIFRSRFQDLHTFSWWSSSYSPHPAPAYCHTLRLEAEALKRTLRSFHHTPHFKGLFAYTMVMRDTILKHLRLPPASSHLIIRILPSGLYEEWFQKGPQVLRHQRFQLPETALICLENPDQRREFMDQKILQLLEELQMVGLEKPEGVVVLWPFETRHTLQSSSLLPDIFICHEGQTVAEALKTYIPPRKLNLKGGLFFCAATWGNALRRMNLILLALFLGLGAYTSQMWHTVEKRHQTWQASFQQRTQSLQQDAKPFLVQQGLWDPDWTRTLNKVDQACKAVEHVAWVQEAHKKLIPLLRYAQEAQRTGVPHTSFHVSGEHIRITRQDTPEHNQAWISALERGPYTLTVTQEPLPLTPQDTGNLLAPKPIPLEKITVIVPLTPAF